MPSKEWWDENERYYNSLDHGSKDLDDYYEYYFYGSSGSFVAKCQKLVKDYELASQRRFLDKNLRKEDVAVILEETAKEFESTEFALIEEFHKERWS